MTGWQPIDAAQWVRDHTHADLRMKNGRVYRAVWEMRGRLGAWWPSSGQSRQRPIALYEPVEMRVIAHGLSKD